MGPPAVRHRIMMVSDFFYPNVGGVENHIYQLSQHLMLSGHKVVVLTHAYGDCRGVRYLSNGLKVYYMHRRPMVQQVTFPTFFGNVALLRHLLIRERINVLHAHAAYSTLALEAVLQARTLGYPTVYTDHSIFNFADIGSILMNKILKCVLSDSNAAICVSHTSRENMVLRACLPPAKVSVIPNAVDTCVFKPLPASQSPARPRDGMSDPITIVVMCRLVYRKGLDLVALAVPHICAHHPNVNVIIGGGGPKERLLRQVIEAHGLQERVTMTGPVAGEDTPDFLRKGHIFLNASLTEAFCMAILEAAACGLLVVSTDVGGVPEVLPDDMIVLVDPTAEGLVRGVEQALARVGGVDPQQMHNRVSSMYSWHSVAQRTTAIYTRVCAQDMTLRRILTGGKSTYQPAALGESYRQEQQQGVGCQWGDAGHVAWQPPTPAEGACMLVGRLGRYIRCGTWMGPLMCTLMTWLHFWWRLVCIWEPADTVEQAADWPR